MNKCQPIDQLIIIQELKANKESALKHLFDLYSEDIYAIAFSVLKDSLVSEDVVQEVYIKLWKSREKLDENENIYSLLYVISKRLSINKLRDMKRHLHHQIQTLSYENIRNDNTDSNVHVKEIRTLEYEGVNVLPEQQRKIYLMSRKEGLTHKEIANKINISPNTVKNHMVQALRTLKRYFQKYGYPFLNIIFLF